MWASMSFRKLCCNSNAGRWIFHICYCCFEIMQVFFFSPLLGVKKKVREFCQRCCLNPQTSISFSFSAQNCSSYTLFCDLKQCGSCAYSNKATWWFLIPRQENRIIWLLRNEENECLWRESERGGGCDGGWGACMCGNWVWQGLKLMISTCSLVANHHKEKVQTKALAVRPRPSGRGRQKFSSRKRTERGGVRYKLHGRLLQNPAAAPKPLSSHVQTCELWVYHSLQPFNTWNNPLIWLS